MYLFYTKGKQILKREEIYYNPENKELYNKIDGKTKQLNKLKNKSANHKAAKNIMNADFAKDLIVTKDVAEVCDKINNDKYSTHFSIQRKDTSKSLSP